MRSFIANAEIDSGDVRVGIILFARDTKVMFHLNQYNSKRQVMRGVGTIRKIEGRTNTQAALDVMRNEMFTPANGDRPDAPNVVIVLTGESIHLIHPQQKHSVLRDLPTT